MRALRYRLSLFVGWLAERRIPGFLRAPIYRLYARLTGADLDEVQLPLAGYTSLSAFFVRRLKSGTRRIDEAPDRLVSPCDGRIMALEPVSEDGVLTVKGRPYTVGELLASAGDDHRLKGGWAWTIYLGPRDYHRVHSPLDARLHEVTWVPGDRRPVNRRSLDRHDRVFATNERAVLRMEGAGVPFFLVMVGALNVGRIRVQGVERGESPGEPPLFEKGAELARFELGSTVVLLFPPGSVEPLPKIGQDAEVRLGRAIGALPDEVRSPTAWRSAKPISS